MDISPLSDEMFREVSRFREWARAYWTGTLEQDLRYGAEWECDYPDLHGLRTAVLKFALSVPFQQWNEAQTDAVIFSLARDNEDEMIVDEITEKYPELLFWLADRALTTGEKDARWQLAAYTGKAGILDERTEKLLIGFSRDPDEYVRRRALIALGDLRSPVVEELALEAWHREDPAQEYSRMAALDALYQIGSPLLEPLLSEAEHDPRSYLAACAQSLRQRGREQAD